MPLIVSDYLDEYVTSYLENRHWDLRAISRTVTSGSGNERTCVAKNRKRALPAPGILRENTWCPAPNIRLLL